MRNMNYKLYTGAYEQLSQYKYCEYDRPTEGRWYECSLKEHLKFYCYITDLKTEKLQTIRSEELQNFV